MPESKYYDKYELTTGDHDFRKGKLGDATREILKTLNAYSGGWYSDYSYMPVASGPWFVRGGGASYGSGAGVFFFYRGTGSVWSYYGSRAVVVIE